MGGTLRLWSRRLGMMLLGIAVAHIGVALFVAADIGGDPFTVFVQGVSRHLGVSVGNTHRIILVVLMLAIFLFLKGYVRPGTVLCALIAGPFIDFYLWVYSFWIGAQTPLPVRVACAVLGSVILAFGLTFIIRSEAGAGANDLVGVILADKVPGLAFRWARMAADGAYVVLGLCLGGTVGAGTILAVLLVGPCSQAFMPLAARMADALGVQKRAEISAKR